MSDRLTEIHPVLLNISSSKIEHSLPTPPHLQNLSKLTDPNRLTEWLELLSVIPDRQQLWIEEQGIQFDSVIIIKGESGFFNRSTRGDTNRMSITPITMGTELMLFSNLRLLQGEIIDIDYVMSVSEFKESLRE